MYNTVAHKRTSKRQPVYITFPSSYQTPLALIYLSILFGYRQPASDKATVSVHIEQIKSKLTLVTTDHLNLTLHPSPQHTPGGKTKRQGKGTRKNKTALPDLSLTKIELIASWCREDTGPWYYGSYGQLRLLSSIWGCIRTPRC